MNLLVVVADQQEYEPARRLLAKAGLSSKAVVWLVNGEGFESKPSMKQLRELKPILDDYLSQHSFDTIIALGETASRLVLDTSTVNINKVRGRDFKYAYGVRTPKKADKKADKEAVQGERD